MKYLQRLLKYFWGNRKKQYNLELTSPINSYREYIYSPENTYIGHLIFTKSGNIHLNLRHPNVQKNIENHLKILGRLDLDRFNKGSL